MAISIDVTVTRAEFEALTLPLIDRTLEICQDAIKYSDYPQETIDIVLLVGGSAQIPLVQARVKSVFGADRVVVHPRPMYAVAEGAAIVAAGLTEKVSTVSRNYCIELEQDPRFVLVKQGEILPLMKTHTLRTVGDGQRLIHFKFFSPDDVRTQQGTLGQNQKYDELIGEMWLVLNSAYPQDTEVLLTIELDEQHSSILKELEVFASKDLTTAGFLLNDFQLVIGHCSQHLHDQQIPIIEGIIDRLQNVLTTQNLAAVESCLTDGTRERDNLPDLIKMVLYCRIGVSRAELIEPTHARSMRIKFDRLLVAMKYKDLAEIDRLIQELLPDVNTYASQSTTTAQINTGIK
jgi:hypothetical protein